MCVCVCDIQQYIPKRIPFHKKYKMELKVIVTTLLILTPTFAHQLRSKKTVNNNFQDSLEVFREQQNDEIERNLICDELCPVSSKTFFSL